MSNENELIIDNNIMKKKTFYDIKGKKLIETYIETDYKPINYKENEN